MSSKFVCMYCGVEKSTVSSLTSGSCKKSPSKFHIPYESGEKSEYTCKYCGMRKKSISSLTNGSCSKSTNKYHIPMV